MGFWLLVAGVGMGGSGDETVIVSGPFCVCAADVFRPGSAIGEFYRPGSEIGQGECDCA